MPKGSPWPEGSPMPPGPWSPPGPDGSSAHEGSPVPLAFPSLTDEPASTLSVPVPAPPTKKKKKKDRVQQVFMCPVLCRLATSVCQPRHDQMEQGPTEPHAGCSTFLLSSGGAGGGYYRVASGTGPIATENQFPCRTLVACLVLRAMFPATAG